MHAADMTAASVYFRPYRVHEGGIRLGLHERLDTARMVASDGIVQRSVANLDG